MIFSGLPLHAINRLLRSEGWASALLKRHAGQSALIEVAGIGLRFLISDDGLLVALPKQQEGEPDVRIVVPASALPSLAEGMENLSRHAHVSGNAQFAETLQTVMRYLRPDLGAFLSPFFGDALAHRIERTTLALASGAVRSARNAGENILEYVRDEKAVLTRRDALEEFSREVARMRDDVARLEKRLERVTKG